MKNFRLRLVCATAALTVGLGACSPTPKQPSLPKVKTPTATATISALPTPSDYMEFLCTRYLMEWQPWMYGEKVTYAMNLTLKDLARPGSKYRKQARELKDALELAEIKIEDPVLRRNVEGIARLRLGRARGDLNDACMTETQ